jgi:hypothetical protein
MQMLKKRLAVAVRRKFLPGERPSNADMDRSA